MTQYWGPSAQGQRITQSPAWRLQLGAAQITLDVDGHLHRAPLRATSITFKRGLFWTRLTLFADDATVHVDGLPNAQLGSLQAALARRLDPDAADHPVQAMREALVVIGEWLDEADAALAQADRQQRWFTTEHQHALLQRRPALALDDEGLWAVFDDPDLRSQLPGDASQIEDDLNRWCSDWPAAWKVRNAAHMQRERAAAASLLDRVEQRPLTDEQLQAVLCFDSRVLVVAAAGSGKTATMVAKAAYAVDRGLVAAEQIVMLAFNKDAASELQQRADQAFQRLGLDAEGVQARTFHALGRQIIGQATGRFPTVPDWAVDAGQGLERLADLVDQLKDRSHAFRTQWDLFRLVFGRDLVTQGSAPIADGWEADGRGYVHTLNGERVQDIEACLIADWLFYNGVGYRYERGDHFDPGTDRHVAGAASFHYTGTPLRHEHRSGAPEATARDRANTLHTDSAALRSGALFELLGQALARHGVLLDPNPDRALPESGARPMPDTELIALVRTFISHAKSNGLTVEDMAQRLRALPEDQFKHRHRLFLALAAPILQGWDDALAAEHAIDFEDMLNQAAELLEQGRYASPYQLVMADEFQDASRARARLCRALVQAPGRHLFAVGDDWQSINRFAGADVSVMTGFVDGFGHGQVLKLEQTFRCPQALCDVSSRFISRNPAQIDKQVRSQTAAQGPALLAFQVTSRDQLRDAVGQYLQQLQRQLLSGERAPGRSGKLSVFVLGRYNADRAFVPPDWQARFGPQLEVRFLTAHRAKGAEADVVILPAMLERSFPNTRADDPVLALAMPHADTWPLGEERRLFYVALTRARRTVAMFSVRGRRSAFLTELVQDGAVQVTSLDGRSIQEQLCPACDGGVIVQRSGAYGSFQSCSGYPRCQYKPRQPAVHATH